MKTVAQEWDKFVVLVLPTNAPPIQRQEMRRAFYAGVQSALALSWDIGGDDVTEDQGIAQLEAWHQECQAFGKLIQQGKA